ncbi:MAG: alanyl-tRNA editing protein [Anaerolineae bacterium]
MSELIYHQDSYIRDFDAHVTDINLETRAVYLDRTAFYPGGGGQPNDEGIITVADRTWKVIRVEKGNAHILDGAVGDPLPQAGDAVHGVIDWERRYKLMRTHTAMHILCGVVWRDYGAQVTGGNMEPLQGRMDFEFERLQKELVSEIEAKINAEVAAARDIRVRVFPREEAFQIPDLIRTKINLLPEGITEVRTVELIGLDLQADGGTHVANTREVGHIRISDYKSKGGINKRIYVEIE